MEPFLDAPVTHTTGLRSPAGRYFQGPMRPSDPLRSARARLAPGTGTFAWRLVSCVHTGHSMSLTVPQALTNAPPP